MLRWVARSPVGMQFITSGNRHLERWKKEVSPDKAPNDRQPARYLGPSIPTK